MTNYAVLSTTLGIGLAAVILFLVRRDHLHLRDGVFWVGISIVAVILGIKPTIIDWLASQVGIAYSPAMLFLVAVIVLIIRATLTDITLSRLQRDVRRLNQRMAIYESDANIPRLIDKPSAKHQPKPN